MDTAINIKLKVFKTFNMLVAIHTHTHTHTHRKIDGAIITCIRMSINTVTNKRDKDNK